MDMLEFRCDNASVTLDNSSAISQHLDKMDEQTIESMQELLATPFASVLSETLDDNNENDQGGAVIDLNRADIVDVEATVETQNMAPLVPSTFATESTSTTPTISDAEGNIENADPIPYPETLQNPANLKSQIRANQATQNDDIVNEANDTTLNLEAVKAHSERANQKTTSVAADIGSVQDKTQITASLNNRGDELMQMHQKSLDKTTRSKAAVVEQNNTTSNVQQFSMLNNTLKPSDTTTVKIPVTLSHPQWAQNFQDQVHWMINQPLKQASIKLNPPELGPVDIQLQVQNKNANIQFHAHHAQVRDAIEQALPKLRDMLDQQGIHLADVDISDKSYQKQSNDRSFSELQHRSHFETSPEDTLETHTTTLTPKRGPGLVDYFA